jgi:hypothetical protein
MITKRIEFGARTILHDGQIQVREDTVIEEDGIELTRSFHRYVLSPGQDMASQPADLTVLADAVWTPDVVRTYQEKLQQAHDALVESIK